MVEYIIVGMVILSGALLMIRDTYKTLSGKDSSCCHSCRRKEGDCVTHCGGGL